MTIKSKFVSIGVSFLFASGVLYVQAASNSLPKTKTEVLSAGLPVVEITTVNGELPTYTIVNGSTFGVNANSITDATKVPGRLTISTKDGVLYDSGDYEKGASGMTIKVRGNSSALYAKKPYKIKLQKKADLLNRGDKKYKNKNWLLIHDINYRAKVGLKVNELIGMQWTPAYEYVNVMINGEYQGLYMLLESVERDEDCRLDVSKNGYIFEYDMYWWKEDYYVKIQTFLPWKMYYTFKYPDTDDMTDEQKSYFADMITAVEASIENGTYHNCIDINSFASWVLAHDILGTSDGSGSNIFLTKYDNTVNSKVMMGNLWDFDSIFQKDKEWSSSHDMFYFKYLFSGNPDKSFTMAYRNRWDEISSAIFQDLDSFLDEFAASEEAAALDISAGWDNQLWDDWRLKISPVQNLVELYKSYLIKRKAWLTYAISQFKPSNIKGDVNGDAYVDTQDITILTDIIINHKKDYRMSRADVNGDGKVNAADIVEIVNIIKRQ